jgi:hypothetical protein
MPETLSRVEASLGKIAADKVEDRLGIRDGGRGVDVFGTRGAYVTRQQLQATIDCGAHSGIPSCCVLFYIGSWRWFSAQDAAKYKSRITPTFTHIPCPKCLQSGRTIRMRRCPKSCVQRIFADGPEIASTEGSSPGRATPARMGQGPPAGRGSRRPVGRSE